MHVRRCSGDFCHAQHADDAIRAALARPLFWGRLANVDEVYESFQEFGLYQPADKRSASSTKTDAAALSPAASTLNQLLQHGP